MKIRIIINGIITTKTINDQSRKYLSYKYLTTNRFTIQQNIEVSNKTRLKILSPFNLKVFIIMPANKSSTAIIPKRGKPIIKNHSILPLYQSSNARKIAEQIIVIAPAIYGFLKKTIKEPMQIQENKIEVIGYFEAAIFLLIEYVPE
jgi:hypothetical protein